MLLARARQVLAASRKLHTCDTAEPVIIVHDITATRDAVVLNGCLLLLVAVIPLLSPLQLTRLLGLPHIQLYEDAWSQGRVLLLNTIMAEDHAQVDRVWQPTAGVGRRRMKRGILAYRAAYPDIK